GYFSSVFLIAKKTSWSQLPTEELSSKNFAAMHSSCLAGMAVMPLITSADMNNTSHVLISLLFFFILKALCISKYMIKKNYFTPLIMFSNAVMWSVKAFSPALVTA